ncbi:MAG: type II secretion system protein GspG [Polyangiaceae bacterium]|nr:type II secretion system protein GspG [Polyangiaceae bacterium]
MRQLFTGSRWRIALFAIGLVLVVGSVASAAEQRARERRTRLAIADVRRAVMAFRTELGRCPRSSVELVHPPRSVSRYLHEMPQDGYGRSIWWRCPGAADPDGVDVFSAGPSGSFLVDDNIY